MRLPSRSKGRVLSVGVVVACLLAVPPGLADDDTAPAIPPKDFTDAPQNVVVRVVSGDTVIVRIDGKAQRIGLIGVEASPLSTSAGRTSSQFLENLLKGEKVYVERPADQPDTDEFGRQPAYLYRAPDGLFVNLEMVRQGYATVADKSAFEHKKLFEHYADKAKLYKKGVWRPAADGANEVAKVEGTDTSSKEKSQSSASDEDTIVYITPSGKKYHRDDCYHLRKNRIPISLAEAKRRGYEPCSHCKPPK